MNFLARSRNCAILALVYVLAAKLGTYLNIDDGAVPLMWPPTGVSLAALVLFGAGLWPGVLAGSLITITLQYSAPLLAIAIATANLLEVLLARWLLCEVLHFRTALDRVRDVIALALVSLGATFVGAVVGMTGLHALGVVGIDQVTRFGREWWWAHLSADLVIAPLLLTWLARDGKHDREHIPNILEILALAAGLLVIDLALFSGVLRAWIPGSSAPFYLLPLLLWPGLRFGPRGAATANFCVGAMAIISTTLPLGPLNALPELQSFVSITAMATLTLSAMAMEKWRAIDRRAAVQLVSMDPIVTVNTRGRILEFNPAAEELFGRRAIDVIGKDASILLPAHRQVSYRRALLDRAGVHHLNGRRINTSILKADGSEREVELSVAAVDVDGEHIATGFIRDRTEERRAERERRNQRALLEEKVRERTQALTRINRELERSEALLRQAEEMAQLGSFEHDHVTDKLTFSDELYRIFGRDRATFTPTVEAFYAAVHPDDRRKARTVVESATSQLEPFQVEFRIVRPDGGIRTLLARGRVFADESGTPTRVAGCCQDVTDRQAAEEARYRLVDIAESSEDAIIGLSTDGVIESWNAAATSIFGYHRDEVIGQPCSMLVADGMTETVDQRLRRTAAGEHLPHYEVIHRRKDGSTFDASVTTSAIRDRDGTVIGLSKILRDISQQKLFEQELKQSLQTKDALLREIHHRVKNNLQVISSLLNLQMGTETSEQSRRTLLESQNRIQSMALVHQLLYQSHDFGHVDLTQYLQALAVRMLVAYNVGQDRIDLAVEGPPVSIAIDRLIPCGLIVNELVANAIDHAFPDGRHGRISLQVRRAGDCRIAVTVRDDGIGIPDGRIQDSNTFGLQIARTLTRQLDGTIAIERDRGTVITIEFPVAGPADTGPEATRPVEYPSA